MTERHGHRINGVEALPRTVAHPAVRPIEQVPQRGLVEDLDLPCFSRLDPVELFAEELEHASTAVGDVRRSEHEFT